MQVLPRSARPRDGGRRTGWLSHPGRIDERCLRCVDGAVSALVRFMWGKGDEVPRVRHTKCAGGTIGVRRCVVGRSSFWRRTSRCADARVTGRRFT